MPLPMPENVRVVQIDVLSDTAETALSHEMSESKGGGMVQKFRNLNFCDNAISQYGKIAWKIEQWSLAFTTGGEAKVRNKSK